MLLEGGRDIGSGFGRGVSSTLSSSWVSICGAGRDNGSDFGRGVASTLPSSEVSVDGGEGDAEGGMGDGARIEFFSDLLSWSSNNFASPVILSSGSMSDFGFCGTTCGLGVDILLNFLSASQTSS